MQTDFLIIGQGISGTLLSWCLLNSGASVVVIDEYRPLASSRVAAGMVNPVTGLRFAENKDFDRRWAVAEQVYGGMSAQLGIAIASPTGYIHFPRSPQEYDAIKTRMEQGSAYLSVVEDDLALQQQFNYSFPPCRNTAVRRINIAALLTTWRYHLAGKGMLIEEAFDVNALQLSASGVTYKGITAGKVIFCDGASALNKHFFPGLPYRENKAQVLIATIPGLPRNCIYKREYTIAPWGQGEFWIGASFEREFTDTLPSADFRQAVTAELTSWLKMPFEITDHKASLRASTTDYQPFVGISPVHSQLAIFNGFGSKAFLYAPHYAKQLTRHLLLGTALDTVADVSRYLKA